MALEIEIMQKGLFKKELKLSDITGKNLRYGVLDDAWRLVEGSQKGDMLVVYDPDHIGRGIEVGWKPRIRDHLKIRMPLPSTSYDVDMLYDVVERVLDVWDMDSFVQDDEVAEREELGKYRAGKKEENLKLLANMNETLQGSPVDIMMCVMWPLSIRTQYLVELGVNRDAESFASYLHDHQAVDFYYAVPRFYQTEKNEIVGHYVITSQTDSIIPLQPDDALYMTVNGRRLDCTSFRVSLASIEEGKIIADMPWEAFRMHMHFDRLQRFDEGHVILPAISEKQIHELADKWR